MTRVKTMIKEKRTCAQRRAHRVRTMIRGTAKRPRLSVKRTKKHLYAQLIDDAKGHTLASASDADIKKKAKPTDIAREVVAVLAKKAQKAGISTVVFDRGAYRYHGRIAALADAAPEGGLKF